jgi:hypothetical protein
LNHFEAPRPRLKAGPPELPLRVGKWEMRMACAMLGAFPVLALVELLGWVPEPGEMLTVALVFVLAAVIFVSWLGMLVVHIGRMLTGRYSWKVALVVLLVPYFGMPWVSLRLARAQD